MISGRIHIAAVLAEVLMRALSGRSGSYAIVTASSTS